MHKYHTEIIGTDINIMKRNENGIFEHIGLIPLVDIPTRANAGEWDNEKVLGMRLIAEYLDHAQGDKENDLLAFRWRVATLYIMETTDKNKTPYYRNHGVTLPLLMDCERFAMANNIEGAMLERFGKTQGTENTILMYHGMGAAMPRSAITERWLFSPGHSDTGRHDNWCSGYQAGW
ncbi:hypothetical protein [Xenorhabdus sp. SGI246]|uniref:hypothetical protein n=1 Tax=Xenorhabdus sp. SGI246 TaxID=3158263 RepID=UPI00349F8F1A